MTHQTISFVKSGFRIAGYVALGVLGFEIMTATTLLFLAAVTLVVSEIIGIAEEIGH